MNQLSELAMWTALVAFFLPSVVALIQQPRWKPATRTIVAAISSLVAGAGTVYFTTPSLFDDGTAMTTVMLTILMASTASYKGFWKPAGVRVIESATSPGDDTIEEEKAIADLVEAQAMMTALGIDEDEEIVTADEAGEGRVTEVAPIPVRDNPQA